MNEEVFDAIISENKILAEGKEKSESIYSLGYYGTFHGENLFLDPCEAAHLLERKKLNILKDGEKLEKKEAFNFFSNQDSRFLEKYTVYKDLRKRGYVVRIGKDTDFIVYKRGVKLEHGGKIKWILQAVRSDSLFSFPVLKKVLELANNVRAKMVWGILDEEGDVTYYRLDEVVLK